MRFLLYIHYTVHVQNFLFLKEYLHLIGLMVSLSNEIVSKPLETLVITTIIVVINTKILIENGCT